MTRIEAHEQMHMVGDAADALRKSPETRDDAAEIVVEAGSPTGVDRGFAVFRGIDEMVVQAQVVEDIGSSMTRMEGGTLGLAPDPPC